MSNGPNEFEIITKTEAAAFEPKKTRLVIRSSQPSGLERQNSKLFGVGDPN